MRTITDKDRQGAAKALQVFMAHVSGQKRLSSKTLLEAVDTAVDEGISFDELFNKENYSRAASVMMNASAPDYVGIMAGRQTVVRRLTDDAEWDNQETFGMIAEAFHAFYKEICPKGGTWNTPNAKLKLSQAIRLYSLQALMSETLIRLVEESCSEKGALTSFLYINELLQAPGKYCIDMSMTEPQTRRKEAEDAEEEAEAPALKTEEGQTELDESIFDLTDDEDPYFNPDMDFGPMDETDGENSFIAYKDPREYKRGCIMGILFGMEINDIRSLMDVTIEKCLTLEDFVTALTDGKIDKDREPLEARRAHQYMRMQLVSCFVTCVKLQGVEITEESASQHDVLLSNWDMRDVKSRKLQKLKQLIYDHGDKDDDDLTAAIRDIEKLYQA